MPTMPAPGKHSQNAHELKTYLKYIMSSIYNCHTQEDPVLNKGNSINMLDSLCSLGKLPTCNLPLPTKCCITVLLECKILGTSHPLHSYNYPSGKQYDSHFTPKTARLRAVEETAGVHTFANIKPWKVTVIHTSVFLTTESMTSAASDVCPHTFLP